MPLLGISVQVSAQLGPDPAHRLEEVIEVAIDDNAAVEAQAGAVVAAALRRVVVAHLAGGSPPKE